MNQKPSRPSYTSPEMALRFAKQTLKDKGASAPFHIDVKIDELMPVSAAFRSLNCGVITDVPNRRLTVQSL